MPVVQRREAAKQDQVEEGQVRCDSEKDVLKKQRVSYCTQTFVLYKLKIFCKAE